MGKITLREAVTNDDFIYIRNLFLCEPGIKEIFCNKETRLICVYHNFIIELDGKPIGFINTVDEQLEKFLFVDMGIKKQYRGKHYGERAILELKKFYLDNYPNYRYYLIGETKEYNDAANRSAQKTGSFLACKGDINFYILNDEMEEDMHESGYYTYK